MAKGNNPISFEDFFDFSDDSEISKAISSIKELRKNFNEFKVEVTGSTTASFEKQMGDLANEVAKVATATKDLTVTNEKHQEALVKNLSIIEKLKQENEALKASKQGSKQVEKALEDSVNGLTEKLKQQVAEYKKLSQAQDTEKMRKLAAEIQVTRYEITELNNATKGTTSIFQAAKGSYAELDAQTKLMVRSLKEMDNGMDSTNLAAQELKRQIAENTAILKGFDAQIGHNFRNVGNYKSAFDGLGMSVQQILREAPTLGISLNTFFLAISNNLPIFFDEVFKARKEIAAANKELKTAISVAREKAIADKLAAGASREAALAAGAQAAAQLEANAAANAAPSVWSRVGASLFSFKTVLTLIVIGLTLFGGKIVEMVEGLFSAESALKAAQKAAADYADEQIRLIKIQDDYTQALNDGSRTRALENELAYAKSIGKSKLEQLEIERRLARERAKGATDDLVTGTPRTSGVQSIQGIDARIGDAVEALEKYKIAFGEAESARTNFLLNHSTVKGAAGEMDKKEYDEELERLDANYNRRKFLFERQKKLLQDYYDANRDVTIKDNEYQKELDEEEEKRHKARVQRLKDATRKMDEIIQASAKYQIAQEELKYAKGAKNEETQLHLENRRLAILEDSYEKRLKLYQKGTKEYWAILTEQKEAEKAHVEAVLKIREKAIEDRTKLALQSAEEQFNKTNKGWVAELALEAQRSEIAAKGFDERMALYKKESREFADLQQAKADAVAASEAKQAQIRINQGKAKEGVSKAEGNVIESYQEYSIRRSSQEYGGEDNSLVTARRLHDFRMKQIEDEIAANERKQDTLKEGDADYYENLKTNAELRKQLVDESSEYELQKAKEVHEAELALRQAMFDFIQLTATTTFDIGRELNAENIEILEEEKKKEMELAGNNARAREQIEENYQKKIIALKRKQAMYDKFQALFNIGLNTAVGVTAAWANPLTAPFMVPIIIASGVLQAAAVLAKPLPRYYKGRGKTGVSEWAEVNEEGFELIERNGKYRIAGSGERGYDFISGDEKVHTAKQSQQIIEQLIENKSNVEFYSSLDDGLRIAQHYKEMSDNKIVAAILSSRVSEQLLGRTFEGAIKNLPSNVLEFNERGFRKYNQVLRSKTEDINSRNSINGNG
jgi:hypothetical protein